MAIEIQVYELSGLPMDPVKRSKVVEDCFSTSTFHVDIPEKNRYLVARVTKSMPPPSEKQMSERDGMTTTIPSIRKLDPENKDDEQMIRRVFMTMEAMANGPVKSKVINVGEQDAD
jgi:hypothetical protein